MTVVEDKRVLSVAPEIEGDITSSEEPAEQQEAEPSDRRIQFQHPPTEESVHDISYHPGIVQFYCPVTQRQKWGDSQFLPRVNWGDTFFDLFFVAAAYNVGNILVDSPNARGLLYFIGCFFPAMQMWRDKVYFDSRFVVGDDIFHRVFETIIFMVGAGGIVHIGSVEVMSNPREHPDMFAFALVLTIFSFMNFVGYLEVYFFGVGQPKVLKQVTLRDSLGRIFPFGLNLAATVIAGVEYFINGAGGRDEKQESDYADAAYDEKDDGHRILAGGAADPSEKTYVNDLPIYLCLGAYFAFFALLVIAVQFLLPRDGSHKTFTIPMNIAFVIHRDGEWIMLMLGESILSLLIVDITEKDEYYTTFFCGILTIIALQYLHYRSQPHDPNLHAMRRDKDAGIWWGFTNGVYSCALIGVGISYKLFLFEFTYDARRLEEEDYLMEGRFLAGADSNTGGGVEERQQAAANIFSAAMAIVFFSLDIMILFHRGLWFSMGRCKCRHTKKKYKRVLLTIARIALCVFFATLCLYENDPNHLAVLGLAGVFAQLIIRKIGSVLFVEDDGDQNETDPEDTKWPNVTHAVAKHTKDATAKAEILA